MPAAAVPIAKGIGAAGSAASGASGKKASSAANKLAQQQLQLQQNQFGVAKQQLGSGNAALGGATNYWNALMAGGQTARNAVGPSASLIGQAAQGARNSIQAMTPRGGEQNLAIAQNYNQSANDISRLYAGMQPLAAQGLMQTGGEYLGSAGAFNPTASPGAAAGVYGQQMQNAQQAGQGYGSLLYNAMNKSSGGSPGGKSNSGANTVGSGPVPLFGGH